MGRDDAVAAAVHTARLEAGGPSAALTADLDRYRQGELDAAELVRRTLARHAVPGHPDGG
jgi:hypothetical protein